MKKDRVYMSPTSQKTRWMKRRSPASLSASAATSSLITAPSVQKEIDRHTEPSEIQSKAAFVAESVW